MADGAGSATGPLVRLPPKEFIVRLAPPDADWAAIHPGGDLIWYSMRQTSEMDDLLRAKGEPLATEVTTTGGTLRFMAADLSLSEGVFNSRATTMLLILSDYRLLQRFVGHVVICASAPVGESSGMRWPAPFGRSAYDAVIAAHEVAARAALR